MISQYFLDKIHDEMEFYKLLEYLPKVDNSYENFNTNDNTGRFGMKRVIPFYSILNIDSMGFGGMQEFIQHEWLDLYYSFLRHLAKLIIGREEYFVFKLIPYIKTQMMIDDGVDMELIAEIMVAGSKNVVIPTFTYVNNHVVEWRCGHCTSPNEMKERHCTQCGAPRAMLIQELQDQMAEL